MSENLKIQDNVIPVEFKYFGNIDYSLETYNTWSGFNNNLKTAFENPITYCLSRNTFNVLTNYRFYDELFDLIKDQKRGSGTYLDNLVAHAQNDYFGISDLSAIGEENFDADNPTFDAILGFIKLSEGDDIRNTVNYSFTSRVSFELTATNETIYWINENDVLSFYAKSFDKERLCYYCENGDKQSLTTPFFFVEHIVAGPFDGKFNTESR